MVKGRNQPVSFPEPCGHCRKTVGEASAGLLSTEKRLSYSAGTLMGQMQRRRRIQARMYVRGRDRGGPARCRGGLQRQGACPEAWVWRSRMMPNELCALPTKGNRRSGGSKGHHPGGNRKSLAHTRRSIGHVCHKGSSGCGNSWRQARRRSSRGFCTTSMSTRFGRLFFRA